MALGGGTFLVQNKTLPGAYINFVSIPKSTNVFAERGTASLALELDWGVDDEIFTVTSGDFQKNSMEIFGYDYTHEKMKPLREIFQNIHTLHCYKLNKGEFADSQVAKAKYSGICGNKITVSVESSVDFSGKYIVSTYYMGELKDRQLVADSTELKNNSWVIFKQVELVSNTGSFNLSNGANGTVQNANHQKYLDKLESYAFNCFGTTSDNEQIKKLYAAYTKRMRETVGVKFQCVLFNHKADYEGVVNVKNSADVIPWVIGILAGCQVNSSCVNKKYDGEYEFNCDYTQAQLEEAIENGEFTFHKVGGDVRVLCDINSLITVSDTKGDIFKENQTIRVCDQIATDIAAIFNRKYLGTVPNDDEGRTALKNDIVKHHKNLLTLRAIENFSDEDIQVFLGDTKKSVVVYDSISVINTMEKLYMTVKIA